MPVFEAPSISITSAEIPSVISVQFVHSLQGVMVGPSFRQFKPLENIRAKEVFPTPRGPVKR